MEETNPQPPTTLAASAPAKPAEKPTDETIKETFEAIIIAFILAFVFRAYVVEAFVIPTGSMAPTLLGEHVNVICPECGYRYEVNPPPQPSANNPHRNYESLCPMCHFPTSMKGLSTSAGDRILVHKFLYSITEPRRWDVVVFKNPLDPRINFIKRLVGLPNESLWIIDGNLYAKNDVEHVEWHIARKTDRPRIQRDVWQPVYHSQYLPIDRGTQTPERAKYRWEVPWRAATGNWQIQNRRSYEHASASPGEITFDFQRAQPPLEQANPWYAYNQFMSSDGRIEPIEDLRIGATFQPTAAGLAVELHTTARLDTTGDGSSPQRLIVAIDPAGHATLEARGMSGQAKRALGSADVGPFAAGKSRTVELWYVDQQASVWVDGERVIVANFDMSVEAATRRAAAPEYPDLGIGVSGSPVTLHSVEVDRDLYYSSEQHSRLARGGFTRESGNQPVTLESDQFFCMGDNSPQSHDSRFWQTVNPWIEKRMFDEETPPHLQKLGVVPRKLMMGRAFFVYFPAPYPIAPGGPAVLPNFGDMRFIH